MRALYRFALPLLLGALWSVGEGAAAADAVRLSKADLAERFLLQVNYSERDNELQNFMTSRSRVVRFEREGSALQMLDDPAPGAPDSGPPQLLATIPIRSETSADLELDMNAGFDRIYVEEDRTGEDYYGRTDRYDRRAFRLVDRKIVSVSSHGPLIVLDQRAQKEDGGQLVVHYYLSRYRPDPDFSPFEMTSLLHFGFYETYPQWHSDRWVLYAMKFNARKPIVFALSDAIPERYRDAVRDGAEYWNRALGEPLLQVIEAPPGVRAPSPDYNVIDWVTSGDYASTSYIQSDPLTGQILHAHVFVLRETMMDGDLEQQNVHLRYIVAHEIGHALGLRHNFAPGRAATVMDYFSLTRVLRIGRDIGAGKRALPYDSAVMRHVYLGEPLDVDALPPFCTDGQKGCSPFPTMPPREFLGVKGNSPAGHSVPED